MYYRLCIMHYMERWGTPCMSFILTHLLAASFLNFFFFCLCIRVCVRIVSYGDEDNDVVKGERFFFPWILPPVFCRRKGSLKGRKWMSIFNIGSRFHDPLRRHKHSAKGIVHVTAGVYPWCRCIHIWSTLFCTLSEKDRSVLRPARSMDSLSSPPYPNEGAFMYFLTFLRSFIDTKILHSQN